MQRAAWTPSSGSIRTSVPSSAGGVTTTDMDPSFWPRHMRVIADCTAALVTMSARESVRGRIFASFHQQRAACCSPPGSAPKDDHSYLVQVLHHSLDRLMSGGYQDDIDSTPILIVPSGFVLACVPGAGSVPHGSEEETPTPQPAPQPPISAAPVAAIERPMDAVHDNTTSETGAVPVQQPIALADIATSPAILPSSQRRPDVPPTWLGPLNVSDSTPVFSCDAMTYPVMMTTKAAREAVVSGAVQLRPVRFPFSNTTFVEPTAGQFPAALAPPSSPPTPPSRPISSYSTLTRDIGPTPSPRVKRRRMR